MQISDLMKQASPDKKNMLLKKLLTNYVLDGDVLRYEIQEPFDKLLSCTNYKKWKDRIWKILKKLSNDYEK